MKLPDTFSITITGRLYDVMSRENASPQLGYYMAKLLTGAEIPDDQFRSWGLEVKVGKGKG